MLMVDGIERMELLQVMLKLESPKSASPSPTNNRPSWRQSELDANSQFSNYQSQQSFKNGETANYGDKGSVRPDLYKEGHSIDSSFL